MKPFDRSIFREIKSTLGRFLAIALIVACGVGIFVGVKATSPSMLGSAETYFAENALFDIQIMSTIGFDDTDIKNVKALKEVDRVTPGYSQDVIVKQDKKDIVLHVMSLTGKNQDQVNIPKIIEGRMPERSGECLISNRIVSNTSCNYAVGDTISFESEAGDISIDTVLKKQAFKIVGTCVMPQYFSYSYGTTSIGTGEVSGYIMVPFEDFSYQRYTELYLTMNCRNEGIGSFDEGYNTELEALQKKLKDTLGVDSLARFLKSNEDELTAAQEEINHAKSEAEAELAAAQAELAAARDKIATGEQALTQGWQEYYQQKDISEAQIKEAEAQIREGEAQFQDAYDAYYTVKTLYDGIKSGADTNYQAALAARNKAQSAYKTASDYYHDLQASGTATQEALMDALRKRELAQAALTNAENTLSLAESAFNSIKQYETQMDEHTAQIAAAKAQIEAGKAQITQSRIDLANALAAARNELDAGAIELDSGRSEYYSGLAEYDAGVQEMTAQLNDGMNRIQNAKASLGELKKGQWYVFSRDDVVSSYAGFHSDAESIDAIADVFPIFFLLVAALVCVTTMTRMIDERRLELGTLKALGYKDSEIERKYIIYSGLAGISGCLVGPAIFVQLLPRVIFRAYSILYDFPDFYVTMPWTVLALAVVVAMFCTVFVAWFCCKRSLNQSSAALMRPKAPKVGKKILLEKLPFLWNRFGFFGKLTARNLLRYKVRLLMTIVGIAGCMALVLAGFGLDNAISPLIDLQTEQIDLNDADVYLANAYTHEALADLETVFKNEPMIDNYQAAFKAETKVWDGEHQNSLGYSYYFVPQNPKDFHEYKTLRDPQTKESFSLDDNGAVITDKIARDLNINVGDTFIIEINEKDYKLKAANIAENYVQNNVFLSPDYYKKVVGSDVKYNEYLLKLTDKDHDEDTLSEHLLSASSKVVYLYFNSSFKDNMSDTIFALRMVVVVMIVCAGLLAFVVLYNLTNINISERTREIATVKVLGFNKKEVYNYVFKENIIMSILGILLGFVFGYLLTMFIIDTVEMEMITFCRYIYPTSYLFSALITLSFTLLVNFFMRKHIERISMVESLKAVE